MPSQKITPFLWYDTEAEEAANLDVSISRTPECTASRDMGTRGQGRRDRR